MSRRLCHFDSRIGSTGNGFGEGREVHQFPVEQRLVRGVGRHHSLELCAACAGQAEDDDGIADVTTMAVKRGYQEVGRRLVERGILADPRDFNFLSRNELYPLLRGQAGCTPLIEAKIAARKRDFDARLHRTGKLGSYLRRGRELELDAAAAAEEDGALRGAGTSRGQVSGVARVIHSLGEIGRVKEGEILVCHATDPGWTPVFLVISGLVLETGGVLAHGSCLSREYGLPCVQLAGATELIPDGVKISIDGDTGLVRLDG